MHSEASHWGRKCQQFYGFGVNREFARDVYSRNRILIVTKLKINEWHNYKNLDWITVRRNDDKLYTFKEGDYNRLRLQDIKDMLLLLIQGKLTNLNVKERLGNAGRVDPHGFEGIYKDGHGGFAVFVFSPGGDLIVCLNKAMAFLTAVASSRVMLLVLEEIMQVDKQGLLNATTVKVKDIWLSNALSLSDQEMMHDPGIPDGQAVQTIIPNNASFQKEHLDTYDSNCDDLSNAQVVLMANISNYGFDVISKEKANKEQNNESVTAELERYKERVKTFKQRLNIDLSSREKMIDSQMDDMIKENLALKEQVDSLEQNLSKQIKEKESLLQTFTVFKNESKEKENKYMENEIDLEKKVKELDNIIYKVGQSAQTVYILTKLQAFYDNIHKQALGYQKFILSQESSSDKPTLYAGIVISDKHVAMHVIDDEEILILEEESRSKMSEKEKDPEAIKQNITHKPIDYEKLNRLSGDFGKSFTPQQAEQAFWFCMSNPTIESSDKPPKKVEVPSELPKKELLLENDQLLQKIMSQDVMLLTVMNYMSLIGESLNMERKRNESCDKCFNLDAKLLKLSNQNALEIPEYFENNDLKAQLQDKDTTICKLKEIIKSLREKSNEENVNFDKCEIATINVELEKSFKDQLDSINKTRVHTKEQSDSLIDKLNLKSVEKENCKAQVQDNVFVTTSLKNNLQKLKGKQIVDNAAQIPYATTIVLGIFKLDVDPLAPRLLQIREAHIDYLKHTQEQADILQG
ncbi:hypothetical protein Tco_0317036 [Tanacetum coccineum]